MDRLVRGSTDLHLSNEGRDYIRGLSKLIEDKGGFWRIYSSSQSRAVETAHLLVKNSHNTTFMTPTKSLASWMLGGMEGKPVKDVLPEIKRLVAECPWVVPVGMGKESLYPGESFNQFKSRVLDEVRRIMSCFEKHPTKRIGVVTHFHDLQLVRAWLARYNGTPGPQDEQYDAKVYNEDKGYPGEVCWFRKQAGKWLFTTVDLNKIPVMPPGIWFIRHGSTAWN
jgi:broad specificity phosphatase PhoE